MNKRIQELAEQCTTIYNSTTFPVDKDFDYEKFALLLIRECATIVENSKWNLPRDHKAIDQANLVKQHFGVEE